jgi:hypothetical protein
MKFRFPGPAVKDPDVKRGTLHRTFGILEEKGGENKDGVYDFPAGSGFDEDLKAALRYGLVAAVDPIPDAWLDELEMRPPKAAPAKKGASGAPAASAEAK